MVKAFSHQLRQSLAGIQLAPGILQSIQSNAVKLAGMNVPSGLDANTQAIMRQAIAQAFVFGFRLIMLICAGLALMSAGVALRMIPSTRIAEK